MSKCNCLGYLLETVAKARDAVSPNHEQWRIRADFALLISQALDKQREERGIERCDCDQSMDCPLGRIASEPRCTADELRDALIRAKKNYSLVSQQRSEISAELGAHKFYSDAAWNNIFKERNELAAAGDRMAHELQYTKHHEVLSAWWNVRGHENCTVCNPK